MMVYSTPISSGTKTIIYSIGNVHRQMNNRVCAVLQPSSSSCYYSIKIPTLRYSLFGPSVVKTFSPRNGFQEIQSNVFAFGGVKNKTSSTFLTFNSMVSPRCYRKTRINVSSACQNVNLRLLGPKRMIASKVKFGMGPLLSWKLRDISAGIIIGLLVCFSTSKPSYADSPEMNEKKESAFQVSSGVSSHGKKVLTDYSVIGIPGDGRCLFRSVAHGACIRSGKSAPNENLQRQLADELRDSVVEELVKRRDETEWFIEGDFESYVSQMRKPHVWGGEPELLMASHVLQMPITVYMHDRESGGLISIAEYGQEEYGKNNPIKILYHGFGHYDALHFPCDLGARPRL